ncbi:HYDIN protein, partial [Galbula dea]|nr:HYDIN protein [Galbula dea]
MATGRTQPSMGSSKTGAGLCRAVAAPSNLKLVREPEEPVTLTPSAFQRQLALSTEQRLASTRGGRRRPQILQLLDIADTSHQKFSAVELDQSLFQPFPSEVVFQNYIPWEVYEVPLVLRNEDKVPRLLKVTLEDSPYFRLLGPSELCQKVAPGMLSTFHILFTPQENKDYCHQLTCTTERERFVVPIRAIGARALLDFPDHLSFSACPVNYSTQRTLLVRNVGTREARCSLSTRSPFSVDPSLGTLAVGDSMQVTVEFQPLRTGDHSGSLTVHYDTGEDVHTSLWGAAVEVNIRLERNSLLLGKTFLGLSNHTTLLIHNQSQIIAHFQWKALATQEEEEQQKLRQCHSLQRQEQGELHAALQELRLDPVLQEHLPLLSRAFQNQRAKVQEDPMLFSDEVFSIEPVEGEVWPGSSAEVTVTFRPQEARVYQQTAYCHISGRELRLPLHIQAEGIGPQLCFSFQQLDIGSVFMGSVHSYEAILCNKGLLDAPYQLVPPATPLGSCFTFLPREGVVLAEDLTVIQISFSSSLLGQFLEEFRFSVHGSPEPVTLTIRGCVLGPTFQFSVPSLCFGDVSFGFPHTLSCRLTNTSLVPMAFSLRVPGDGLGEASGSCWDLLSGSTRPLRRSRGQHRLRPAEFSIAPSTGTVRAQGALQIQVTLCSNTVRSYSLALVLDVDGVGREVFALPITARCVVPQLQVLNPVMNFGQCFLKLPQQQLLTLVNPSDLPACYRLIPQEHREGAAVWYSSSKPCGIIQPHSSMEVPVSLEAQVTGGQETVAHLVVVGNEGSPLRILLVSTGEGPVVYVHPSKLNFGRIQVLQDAVQTLYLSNQSLIPAPFRAEMAGRSSCWRVEPQRGVIPPESEVAVAVIANLDDTVRFQEQVKLLIENSPGWDIPVQALGVGTTIVTDRALAPEFSLGTHFCLTHCSACIKLTNRGRRPQQLYWTTEGSSLPPHRLCVPASMRTKGKGSSQHPKAACAPVLKLQPLRMELLPGQMVEMVLEGFSSTPQVVKERLLCHAIVGDRAGKVQIMQVDVSCQFIAPALQISSREITFQVQKHPGDVLTLQHKPLSLKNISSLPLSIVLSLEQPFSVCQQDQQPLPAGGQAMKLEVGEELPLSISFNPAYEEGLRSWVAEKVLQIECVEYPHKEQVPIRGEVYFPNLQLQPTLLDFGCILNDTEQLLCLEMSNCSPLPVQYHWAFLPASQLRFSPPAPKFFTSPQWAECSVSAGSSSMAGGVEEPAEGLVAAEDSTPGSAGEDDSPLEAKLLPTPSGELEDAAKLEEDAAEAQSPGMTKELMPFVETEPLGLGVQEVFDVLPLHGELQPGESQEVTFTFFGHSNIVACATALCRVEGGPTYELMLRGEASLISYLLDVKEIDCGLQLFHEVTEAEVTLRNRGKVTFSFVVLSPSTAPADSPLPGVPLVLPSMGDLGPGKEQVLKVYYLPGVPGVFCRTFQIQVGHLEPEEISLKGEGSFPRICLDLPRHIQGNEKYEKILQEVKAKMGKDSEKEECVVLEEAVATEPTVDNSDTMLDTWLQMQVEELLLEEHALEEQKALSSGLPGDITFDQQARQRLLRAELPEYLLDFGYVILGDIQTHIVKVTNTGHFPVSFQAKGQVLHKTGFTVELDRVKQLPCCETQTFQVRCDPQGAKLPLGEVDVLLPIKVAGGPTFHVRLRASVTMPALCLSRDSLEFSSVQCGQCQEETLRLHNQLQVPCKWFITLKEPVQKVDKHLPLYVRQRLLRELRAKPPAFEVLPPAGALAPGQRCDLRVRFSPTEEKSYRGDLKINICQSSQHLQLQVRGQGLEPRLEFSPPVLDLGPVLPSSQGAEGTVVVKNPCKFPIEFYSLEFDQQYLAEEQILRLLKDYDSNNTLLLPPRAPGEKLPPEVLQFYQDQKRLQDEQAKPMTGEAAGQDNANPEDAQALLDQGGRHSAGVAHSSSRSSLVRSSLPDGKQSKVGSECGEEGEEGAEKRPRTGHQQSSSSSKEAMGELDESPVSRAITRHLGSRSSPEGRAARSRRGIILIIHGAPLAGKTRTAVALSRHYGAACLSLDALVTEAIADRSSSAGLRARELCLRAAIQQSCKEEAEDAGPNGEVSLGEQLSSEVKPSPEGSAGDRGSQHSVSSRSRVARGRGSGHGSQAQKHLRDPPGSQESSSSHLAWALPQLPAQQWLSISSSTAGQQSFRSCVLPEDLLVAILSERLQLSDCYQGVVFDGLETLFACNMASALLCLLKAVRNRPYIYLVNLFQDYAVLKAREAAAKEQEEREREAAAQRERARLLEMDEDEYDALSEEQKAQFDDTVHQIQQERRQREMEQLAQELEEQRQQELERLKLEEELKKKSKRGKKELGKDKENAPGQKSQPAARQSTATGHPSASVSTRAAGPEVGEKRGGAEEQPDSAVGDKEEKKKKQKKTSMVEACPVMLGQPSDPEQEESREEAQSESEKSLALRFRIYEAWQKEVAHILSSWDRVQGLLLPSPSQEEGRLQAEEQRQHGGSSRRSRREKKERLEKERLEKPLLCWDSRVSQLEREGAEGAGRGQDVGVPCLDIDVLSSEDVLREILESGKLPPAEQILDELGLGPSGPPIPPPAFYSVIHYPGQRVIPAAGEALEHFSIVPGDAPVGEEKKDPKSVLDVSVVAKVKVPGEEQVTPTRSRSRKEKASGSRDSLGERLSSGRLRRGLQRPGSRAPTPSLEAGSAVDITPSPRRPTRLSSYRWIVPAQGEVQLKVHFSSRVLGQFDQTLHFELLGTKQLYPLHCRGSCLYPTISQDPRVVFPHWRKSKAAGEIITKQYIMKTGVFHFGPLLCGKSRDWYKALQPPSNCEKLTILNITAWEAEVHFSFEHDLRADTFILDPPSMKLKPNEKQELSIWAYPTSAGLVRDNLICHIRENPEPVVFHLCCQGVQVELGVSPKQLHFNKLLLHRRDSKSLLLRNSTPLPMAWRLSGLESLGEDFSLSQREGIVAPRAELGVQLSFRASRVQSLRRMLRLEVSDAEEILGVVQTENIQVTAEAYDVALNINISKGADGSLDFGTLRVLGNANQVLTLKNKGKYEIAYSFRLESPDATIPSLAPHFTVQPCRGVLPASERPVQVQVQFHPKRELHVEDKPILQCQVIEPNVCEGGETIATIPLRVSARAVFSKYSISPASLLNFGPMMNGTKKSCSFTLENQGLIDFQFFISKAEQDTVPLRKKSAQQVKSICSQESEALSKASPPGKQSKHLLQKDPNTSMQARLTLGMFTVYPGFGCIPPGTQQVITVDCLAEPLGTCEEHLSIHITHREPRDNPLGIPYTLLAESCIPGLVVDDLESIFEEHQLCSSRRLWQRLGAGQGQGVFLREENTFFFPSVLLGQRASARFRILNGSSLPCPVLFSLKPIKVSSRSSSSVFGVEPARLCLPGCSHAFATVTFTPQKVQSYQCVFEASLDVSASPVPVKAESLTFKISGDGNLPQVVVLQPALHTKAGDPLLLFRKLLLGETQKLPLVLQNGGTVPVQFMLDLLDEEGVFFLKARPTTHCIYLQEESPPEGEGRKPHTAALVLHPGELAELDVLFKPRLAQRAEGKIQLAVVGNPSGDSTIQLLGEGCEDDFTLDNIHGRVAASREEDAEGRLEEDIIEASRVDHIQFGDCHIGTAYPVTFTITNRGRAEAMRFQWLPAAAFHFSPQVGHLHAGCAKDITVTLKSDVPVTFQRHPVKCQVSRITFQLPPDQVADWDDCLHTVKWVDGPKELGARWPVKRKVMEPDPEPAHTVLEESTREVELHLSAAVGYAEFKLHSELVEFKETLLFQTRTCSLQLSNTGSVALEYTWTVAMEQERVGSSTSLAEDFSSSTAGSSVPLQSSHSSRQLGHTPGQVSSILSSSLSPLSATPPFSIEPCSGSIPAGQEQLFQIKFSPLNVGDFEGWMLCRSFLPSIPNLKPDQKGPEVALKGRSLMSKYHFELEDSDYISARRCNPQLQGPGRTPLDPSTRVVEVVAVGVGGRNSRTFTVLNPTSSTYSFQWTCQDPEAPAEQVTFFCLTERGQIQPGKRAEMKFEFIPCALGITESFWVFTIPEESISVPFLLVGNATDPLVALDRSYLKLLLVTGHQACQTIYLINQEKVALSFAFRRSSLVSEGCKASLKIEPLQGCIAPLSRLPITVLFTPRLEGEVVFNVKCNVKRKPQPLSLNIKATACS